MNIWGFSVTILVVLFYISFYVVWIRPVRKIKKARKLFYSGVISVLDESENDYDCYPDIALLYERLAKEYPSLKEKYYSATELLGDMIVHINTLGTNEFKLRFDMYNPKQKLSRLVSIRNILLTVQPFSSLPAKQADLVKTLKQAIETDNEELATNALNQLVNENLLYKLYFVILKEV